MNYYDYNRNPAFFLKIIRFQVTFKSAVELPVHWNLKFQVSF